MRSSTGRTYFSPACRAALAAGLIAAGMAGTATAGSLYEEQVHADSFGNLVIYSPSGYKRIIVGEGYLADQLAAGEAAGDPEVVYLDEYGYRRDRRCNRRPVLLHGRSYMYGLPDHVVPVPAGICD